MRIIGSPELKNSRDKWLDLQRERSNTTASVSIKENYLKPDEDFARAISFEAFRDGAINHIKRLYQQEK